MKTKNFIPIMMIATALTSLTFVAGCKKDKDNSETDFQSEAQDIGQTEEISTSLDNTVAEAFQVQSGGGISERNSYNPANSELSCGVVTVVDSNTITIS